MYLLLILISYRLLHLVDLEVFNLLLALRVSNKYLASPLGTNYVTHCIVIIYIYVYVCICIYMYVYIYIYVYWHCRSIYVSVWNSTIFKHSDIFEQSKMSKWQELWILNKVKSCILLIKQKRPKCHSCTPMGGLP